MNVKQTAIALFNQEWLDFQGGSNLSWIKKGAGCVQIHHTDRATTCVNFYFHAENAVVDLSGDIVDGDGWLRFQYADPVFPSNLIALLYRRALGYVRKFRDTIPLFEYTEQVLNLLLTKHERLDTSGCNRDAGVLVVGCD